MLCVDDKDASAALDEQLCKDVASRLWIIVLSEKQEKHLVLSLKHLGLIRAHITEEAGRS